LVSATRFNSSKKQAANCANDTNGPCHWRNWRQNPHIDTGKNVMHQRTKLTLLVVLLGGSSMLAVGLAQKQPKVNTPSSTVWKAPVQGQPDDYAGAEACAACHPVHSELFNKSPHARAAPKDVKYGAGCESCHGPGKAHIQAIEAAAGDDQKIAAAKKLVFGFHGKPEENSGRCLTCHVTSHDQSLFDKSEHKLHGVACQQ